MKTKMTVSVTVRCSSRPMSPILVSILILMSLLFTEAQAQKQKATVNSRRTKAPPIPVGDECALFKGDDKVALTTGKSSYIELGEVDVTNQFSISMEVMPSRENHNGILFSVGTRPNFGYYEWKTAAVNTQFIVVEFIFSAAVVVSTCRLASHPNLNDADAKGVVILEFELALTVKALGMEHLQQIEVYKTYPHPYKIDDAQWHTVKAYRADDKWTLIIDNLNKTIPVTNKTDVQLIGKPGHIGGRPAYTNHQFQGIIRKLRINNKAVQLGGKNIQAPDSNLVQVWHCTAEPAKMYMHWINLIDKSKASPHRRYRQRRDVELDSNIELND